MKSIQSLSLALLATSAVAAPAADRAAPAALGYEYNELKNGECKDVTFIWVRGTTELSNMGEFVGGRLVPYLQKTFPSLAIQGVAYGAGVTGNLLPGGGDYSGITEAQKMYNLAVSKCPKTVITGGGYSQGAAITHRAIEKLPEDVKGKIAGITLYGDTQYYQDKGMIKGFPPEKVHTYCNGYAEWKSYSADGVCNGLLVVNYGHMSYGDALQPGADFLQRQVNEFKASKTPAKPTKKEPEPVEEEAAPAAAKKKASGTAKKSSSTTKPAAAKAVPAAPAEEEAAEEVAPAPKKKSKKSAAAKAASVVDETTQEEAPAPKKTVKKAKTSMRITENDAVDLRAADDSDVAAHMRNVFYETDTFTAGNVPTML